jgi:hypothetical protein
MSKQQLSVRDFIAHPGQGRRGKFLFVVSDFAFSIAASGCRFTCRFRLPFGNSGSLPGMLPPECPAAGIRRAGYKGRTQPHIHSAEE